MRLRMTIEEFRQLLRKQLKEMLDEAPAGTQDPRMKPKSSSSSAALHTRDKSQMQGVGPRPTMANAFGDEKKESAGDDLGQDEIDSLHQKFANHPDPAIRKMAAMIKNPPSADPKNQRKLDRDFKKKKESLDGVQQEDHTAHSKESGYTHEVEEGVDQSNEKVHGYDGMDPADYDVMESKKPKKKAKKKINEVSPPSDKAEDFVKKNKGSFKKRYGARWKDALYATAWKKFGKKENKKKIDEGWKDNLKAAAMTAGMVGGLGGSIAGMHKLDSDRLDNYKQKIQQMRNFQSDDDGGNNVSFGSSPEDVLKNLIKFKKVPPQLTMDDFAQTGAGKTQKYQSFLGGYYVTILNTTTPGEWIGTVQRDSSNKAVGKK